MRHPAILIATISAGSILASPVPAVDYSGSGSGNAIDLSAWEARAAEQAAGRVDPAVRLEEYERRPECDPNLPQRPGGGVCFPGTATDLAARICNGDTPVEPLWRRERTTPTTPWSPWGNILGWTCPVENLPAFTAADFARLPLDPPPLLIQPDRTEHLVNMPTIVWTQPTQQLLTTTLLGHPIEVEATPATYTWDFGDTTHQTTTSPGAPYPHHDTAHPYPAPGTYTITLTVTYTGRYRLAGTTTWATVDGTATTTTTAPPITVIEAPTHLVIGDCHTHPHHC